MNRESVLSRILQAVLWPLLISTASAQDPTLGAGAFPDNPDPQTGYFLQVVTLVNPSPTNYPGVRVFVRDLPADLETNIVRVANAHGITTDNIPYFDFGTVPSGASVDFAVEFYIQNRRNKPAPRYEAITLAAPPVLLLPTAFLVNTNATRMVEGKFFAEFKTEEGRAYYIQYNSSVTATNGWTTSMPPVRGTGSFVQWSDTGPPRTESKPTESPSRFYRVVVLP